MRALSSLACAVVLAASVGAGPAHAAAPVPAPNWTDCQDGFQCAKLPVPFDYGHPGGEQIQLAMIRLPATDPGRRIGSLFVNFGGPGGDGVEHLRQRAHWDWLFSKQLRERFDLVSWDPRGVGKSVPVNCFPDTASRDEFMARIPAFPDTAPERDTFYRDNRDLANRCRAQAGRLLDHVSTADTARDLDRMRRAVGDSALNFHGISYGTQLGATYASLFPDRVRAMVLDGSLDFQGNSTGHGDEGRTTPLDTRQRVPEGVADTFASFLRQCAAPDARCAFAGGDLEAKFAVLTAAARQKPLVVDGTSYTYADVINYVNGKLASPDRWQDMAVLLQKLYVASGEPQTGKALRAASAPYQDNSGEAFNAIQCADSIVPRGSAPYTRAAARETHRVPYWGALGVYDMMPCAYWRAHATDRYLGPYDRSPAPILMINSRHDPSTPLAGARDGQRELRNARMLVVNGSGHSTMLVRSHCAEAVKRDYLFTLHRPRDGASCDIDDTPFDDVPPPPD
ncbi:alpha/beta hydrolase [Sciscionella sediminilitoris]|uniref:alpha/beta hydrolase n=1 Tax=Sciscionella sediminilitoris TaxID=1445613 RepID=UPI0004DEE77F|nr:alpha/beta hydrolase [Sciscionella sp. SE31]